MFVGVLATPLQVVQHEQSAPGKKKHTKCAAEEECKTKTSQHEKVKLGIVGYMKRVQHKKNSK